MSKDIIRGLVVFVANVGVFLMTVPFFLNEVHHHWIIPVFAVWLLFQSIVFVSIDPKWGQPALRVIMGLSVLMGAILFWRQFSMFHCFRHCEGRLTVGLLLLSGANGIAWRFGPFNRSRWLWGAALVFLGWAIIVMAIGLAYGTWNFR
ncbi:MAG: hypothetical protein IPN19_06980 [Elusimicrobia bacterium]|nr:hypothetical protein [Elusimicrobiota bacterium]